MKEIHVKFAGVEKASDDKFAIIYIPNQRQVLMPGRRYKIVIDDLGYGEGRPKEKKEGTSETRKS